VGWQGEVHQADLAIHGELAESAGQQGWEIRREVRQRVGDTDQVTLHRDHPTGVAIQRFLPGGRQAGPTAYGHAQRDRLGLLGQIA